MDRASIRGIRGPVEERDALTDLGRTVITMGL